MTESLLWNEIGTIYQKMGMLDDSIQAFQRAVEQCSGTDAAQFISNLASSYLLKNEYGRAISLLKKGLPYLKTVQEQAAAWNKIGDAYRALKDLDNAIVAYHKADELEMQTAPLQNTSAPDQNLAAALEEMPKKVEPREQPADGNAKTGLVMTNTPTESPVSAGIRQPSSKDFSVRHQWRKPSRHSHLSRVVRGGYPPIPPPQKHPSSHRLAFQRRKTGNRRVTEGGSLPRRDPVQDQCL